MSCVRMRPFSRLAMAPVSPDSETGGLVEDHAVAFGAPPEETDALT